MQKSYKEQKVIISMVDLNIDLNILTLLPCAILKYAGVGIVDGVLSGILS